MWRGDGLPRARRAVLQTVLLHVVVRLELVGEQRNAGGREVSERVRLGSVVQTGRSSGEKLADGVRIGELNGDGPPGENPRLQDGPESSALRMEARDRANTG